MKILAIETSCDDTGIAVLEVESYKVIKFKVLSNIVSSQQIHANYGGVFPMMAKREHQRNLVPVLAQALTEAKILKALKNKSLKRDDRLFLGIKKILEKENTLFESVKTFLETHEKPDIDYIAVTHGPGLEPCLYVGVNFAKALSYFWDIPVIPVNHIEAHILVNFIDRNLKFKNQNSKLQFKIKNLFPAISLVVSGGHTQLILVKDIGKYKIIGETLDDAAGECFDKAARILGLGYPGGPQIAALAAISQTNADRTQTNADGPRKPASSQSKSAVVLPRPMMHIKDYDFSFSGLKTAVLYKVRDEVKARPTDRSTGLDKDFVGQMCVAVQDAICDVLIKKTINAAKAHKAKTIILGGGVSANQELRKQLLQKIQQDIPATRYLIPDSALSTDNALMIAVAGYFNKAKKIAWQKLSVNANLRVGK